MKKIIFAFAICAFALGACNNGKSCNSAGQCGGGDRKELYTGILPAADAAGILYSLELDYDDDHNYTTGDYDLTETYLLSDSVAAGGKKDGSVFKTEGDFSVMEKDAQKYIKLMPEAKHSTPNADNSVRYFLVSSDSTLTLVGSDLKPAEDSGLNYTLTRK